jgi:pyridoxamine 5'-phosphate oxidase
MSIAKKDNPLELFAEWYEEAQHCGLKEPTAVTLATADATGMPSARVVLLKAYDERGFVFYTNLGSEKCDDLKVNPQASLCFHWQPLTKQVRLRGKVEPVSAEEADAYFASRDRKSRIGAYASKQSQPLESPHALEKRVARFLAKFHVGNVPRPEFWSGYRVIPDRFEFWLAKPFRLHDRLRYTRHGEGWTTEWLYP